MSSFFCFAFIDLHLFFVKKERSFVVVQVDEKSNAKI